MFVGIGLGAGLLAQGALAASPANDFLKHPLVAEATIDVRPSGQNPRTSLNGFTPAPLPNLDQDAPTTRPLDPKAARMAPRIFHRQSTYHGEGYVFGSTVQEQQDRRVQPAPGINLIMPLQ